MATGKKIQATATCGVNVTTPEQFCRLTGVAGEVKESDLRITINSGQLCEECDPSEEELSHPAEFAIDGTERWWQSPPLSRGMEYNAVNLSIDLEQVTFILSVFKLTYLPLFSLDSFFLVVSILLSKKKKKNTLIIEFLLFCDVRVTV